MTGSRSAAAVAVAVTLAALAALATGAAVPAGATSFAGRCTFTGTFTYARPVGFAPASVDFTAGGPGTCTGQLDNRAYSGPAAVSERLHDDVGGCGPASDAHGTGVLTFPAGRRVAYATRHPLVVFGAPFVAQGTAGGVAAGIFTAYAHSSPQVFAQCAAAAFVRGRFDLLLHTFGALRSGGDARAAGR